MKVTDQTTHEALRRIPYGLYIVGVHADGQTNAMAASWVTQCSFDPPLIMVAVRKNTHTYHLIRDGGMFTLNLLDKKHADIIRELEKPFHMAHDKIDHVSHDDRNFGPVLEKAFAFVECQVREIFEPGDHALVIGEVIDGGLRNEGDPIMCSDLKWHYGG